MNLIKDRNARTKDRKRAKDKLDKEITLSANLPATDMKCTLALEKSEGDVRLLDEGAIVTASGNLDLYIKKGTLRKYATGKNTKISPRELYGDIADEYFKNPDEPMNLNSKYEGTINIGHNDFTTFPFIVGTWKQSDLKLVNNGDGRKGLDVDLKLNEAHPLVQALRVQDIPVGVSVEMYYHIDTKATEAQTEERGEYTPVVDEIFISDFAIVGECGNVGSSDSVNLKGGVMKDNEELMAVQTEEDEEELEAETTVATSEEVPTEEDDTTDENSEVDTEDVAEDDTDDEVDEESTDEADTEDGESEESANEEDHSEVVLEAIESLQSEVKALHEQIDALKKTNRKLNKKLQAKHEADEKFMAKFKGLEVSLGEKQEEQKEEVTETLYANGDGRGVL